MNNYSGFKRAVIINNEDPLKMERVKVRVIGIHPPNSDSGITIPDEALPWAEKAGPLFGEGGISSGGMFSVPRIGSVVWVFFEADNPQIPIYFATSSGKASQQMDVNSGFGVAVNPQNISAKKSDVPDWSNATYQNRLDNYKSENFSKMQTSNLLSMSESTSSGWSEPSPQTPGGYGNTIGITTTSGVSLEIDTDPVSVTESKKQGSQRITLFHPSGSFQEFQLNGNIIEKCAKEKYNLTYAHCYNAALGNMFFSSWNQDTLVKVDRSTRINSEDSLKVLLNRTEWFGGEHLCTVIGNQTNYVGGWQQNDVVGWQTISVQGTQTITVTGVQTFTIGGAANYTYTGIWTGNAQSINFTTTSFISLTTSGETTITSPDVTINAGTKFSVNSPIINLFGSVVNIKAGMILLN